MEEFRELFGNGGRGRRDRGLEERQWDIGWCTLAELEQRRNERCRQPSEIIREGSKQGGAYVGDGKEDRGQRRRV